MKEIFPSIHDSYHFERPDISLLFPYVRNEKPHTMDKFLYSFLCFISALAADL